MRIPDDRDKQNRQPFIDTFFCNTDKTMVLSFLQGHMGGGWLDCLDGPTCAAVAVGDFCALAGAADSPQAERMVRELAKEQPGLIDCLEKNLWPNWDAHTLNSVGLALKLGYQLDKEYTAFTRL